MADDPDALSEQALAEGLRAAGFQLLELRYEGASIPIQAAWAATTCQPGEGGRCDVIYDLDSLDLVGQLNSTWSRVVTEVGLLDGNGRFLLSVISSNSGLPEPHWALVCVREDSDIAGIGASYGIFGFRPGYIEFAAASLDGRAIVRGTLWQSTAGILAISDARGSIRLREYVRGLSERGVLPADEDLRAQIWLATEEGSSGSQSL
ncbi:hypothetical protein [Actinomadura rupiterrae]|uniref:hypothetical protein n=1 Tax=Actinomadura rupiterrae TaxID=559627 RepID=UPI0020A26AE3|nr:hypothetical protein [Actinomadura rupiterrae]MCP2337281.1 hypothetical protein [Actinomadura rupiterrae]